MSILRHYRSAGTATFLFILAKDQSALPYLRASEVRRLIGASVQSEVTQDHAGAGHATWVALGCEGATTRFYTAAPQ